MDHTDRKKKISISTKASLPPHSLVMYTSYLNAIFSSLHVYSYTLTLHVPGLFCTLHDFSHCMLDSGDWTDCWCRLKFPSPMQPLRYHSPVKQPSLAISLSSLCVTSGVCERKLTVTGGGVNSNERNMNVGSILYSCFVLDFCTLFLLRCSLLFCCAPIPQGPTRFS